MPIIRDAKVGTLYKWLESEVSLFMEGEPEPPGWLKRRVRVRGREPVLIGKQLATLGHGDMFLLVEQLGIASEASGGYNATKGILCKVLARDVVGFIWVIDTAYVEALT